MTIAQDIPSDLARAGATHVDDRPRWLERYHEVRSATQRLTEPLETEDFVLQTMPDVSPAKWHLAHTTWFFEQFLLLDGAVPGYRSFHPQFGYLFNSYYVTVGDRHCRIKRGTISRPTVADIFAYRAHVDEHVARLIESADAERWEQVRPRLEIGLNHEQQHQELLLTDIKHVFSCNPLYPVYSEIVPAPAERRTAPDMRFVGFEEGVREVGHDGEGFAWDNERPRHKVYVHAFEIADRLVTNGEFLEFVKDGGYGRATLWLSEGAATVASDRANWSHPFYWHRDGDHWLEFTLAGMRELDPHEPVCHLSYFEADAFARWRGCRLPTEFEWEVACVEAGCDPAAGNFVETEAWHPQPAGTSLAESLHVPPADPPCSERRLHQVFGDAWEWTASQYTPYPGFRTLPGALGEYNGKFMSNQFVLRGGSCATPRSHIRPTYRNFFPAAARWQFSGLRLARDV